MGLLNRTTGSSDLPSSPESVRTRRPRWLHLEWWRTPSGLTFLVIAAFVVAGGYTRLEALGSVSVWNDEAQSTLLAFSILQHGYPIIVAPHLIDNWEPLYPYFEAASILVLGHTNFAYRLPSALFGIALIPLSYGIGARLRDRYVGITLAAMVAFSTEYIGWSRQARWYMLFVVLMALGLLAVMAWNGARSRRARGLCVAAMAAAFVGVAVTSIGLFLLYIPGILLGAIAFIVTVRWKSVRRFFLGPEGSELASRPTVRPIVPYRYRLGLFVLLLIAVVTVGLLEERPLSTFVSGVITRVVGFPPYSLVYSTNFGTYLLDYYPAIVVLSFASAIFIAWKRDPVEVGLLTFCVGSFLSVSIGASLTNDIAGGTVSFERHIVPLLFFLFLLSAISIVGTVRSVGRLILRRGPSPRRLRQLAPALYGVAIVAMLVVPSAVVPTSNTLYEFKQSSPVGSLIAWVPFSLDPPYPSALYEELQANYELAAEYVLHHRTPGEVVGATNAGPPTVYLGVGQVQYWIRGNPIVANIIYVDGQPEFFETGSVLIDNTTQLEGLLYASGGWLISDDPAATGPPFPNGMNLVVRYFMTYVAAGSDISIGLYHWNQSTPSGLVQRLIAESPDLNATLGRDDLQVQLGWAVTTGMMTTGDRDLLEPMATDLLPLISNTTTRGQGVLFTVYDSRVDLQQEFPEVVNPPYNDSRLFSWACGVASGAVPDPASALLSPYESVYCS